LAKLSTVIWLYKKALDLKLFIIYQFDWLITTGTALNNNNLDEALYLARPGAHKRGLVNG